MTASKAARIVPNPAVSTTSPPSAGRAPQEFHRKLPGYAESPLVHAPEIARELGVGSVLLKDESSRLGLPAFKILGASWAVYRALDERIGGFAPWETIDDLRRQLDSLTPLTLSAATDGNHGRAVARMAKLLGFDATIYVPAGTTQARIDGIASEGAPVIVVDGTYDEAVARSSEDASERCLVISDTSWPGYENIPRWVIDGYSTILWEVEDQLRERGEPAPDLVAVQIGVGALATAVVTHFRQPGQQPKIVGVEPLRAACMLSSIEAGHIVSVPGPHDSIMAGLNCGEPSMLAWPVVSTGVDLFVAVDDERAREAMRLLATSGVVAGETGAAGLAGLLELLHGPTQPDTRQSLGVNDKTRILLFITEGATDPEAYAQIVGNQA
ncbi:MAG TPA: diaminopropionate ammonia-lyase [Thermomicrobiales bacterium]|nr:diaminopropionate ammonia-lyase [Thermomicrobiales bacterium]